ncbi:hypothetical protein L1785_22180 [Antribacter sp. KLBMP9083]|uniref:Uncharacterized protein n=1 Tax=Antribacter soli TaxID=2910976 RepID=A0AA41U971_9MICO|nr:hypothetical protein [Antribacter soli]MCF4123673.1 hypothetical protein [Antribacter soli]
MNTEQPVAVRIDVDPDGHLTVTVGGDAWVPPAPGGTAPEVGLGRTDVPWVLDRLLGEHGRPLHVVLLDGGRTFTDVVLPEHLKRADPSYSKAPPGFAPDRHRPPMASYRHGHADDGAAPAPSAPQRAGGSGWFEAGGYNRGEQVAVAVIVTRVTADDEGRICLILPAALRPLIGDAVAIGEESREISINQASQRFPGSQAVTAALSGTRPGGEDLDVGFRHRGGPGLGM